MTARFRTAFIVLFVVALILGVLPFGAWAESADLFDAAAISGAVADIATTEVGLRRGYVEQNIQQRGPRIAANVALTGGCLALGRYYEKQGHKGWGRVLKLVPAVVFGGAAIKNIQTMRRKP